MIHRLAPFSFVFLATALAFFPQPATAERAAPLPTLQGEAALAHLRREGLDGSLAEVLTQQAYVKASNTEWGDSFGIRLAVSGDTLVVGAVYEGSSATGVNGDQSNNSAPGSGAAYVFVRSAGTWSQQAYLKASNTSAGDYFGSSVAISGDTLVVGAWGEDSSATGVDGDQSDNSAVESGAAYVFVRNAGTWSQQAYLKASNTSAGDYFGSAVAISGDTLVVGADSEDSNATGVNGDQSNNSADDAGAAYVFVRSADAWSQQAYLKASNTGAIDLFGRNVAISANTLVVGAHGEDSNATGVDGDQSNNLADHSGAAYVFVRSADTWSHQAYLKASNTDAYDLFGFSVAISANTLVVGAYGEDSNATGVDGDQSNNSVLQAGAAYVFVRSAGVWSQQAYLKASNPGGYSGGWDVGDLFGVGVAISGDTLVVGASGEDSNSTGVNGDQSNNSAPNAGAAYVFVRSAGIWSQQAYLKASNTDASDEFDDFGRSVAISGDTVAVGALYEDSNATGIDGDQSDHSASNAGAAYVFVTFPGSNLEMAKVADVPNPLPRETVVFTLTVTNQGPDGATGVVATDTLPAGLTYQSNDCGAAFAAPTLTWTIGALANLASATCHLTVTVNADASKTILNTAAVDGNEFDPQTGDNAAGAMLSSPMDYYTLTPCRLVDTRLADGPLVATVARDFVLAGACGIPADAAAVVLNVTAVGPTTGGSVQIYRAGGTPLADGGTVYYRAGFTRAGNAIVTLGTGGAVTALAKQPGGRVHLILDVVGYFF